MENHQKRIWESSEIISSAVKRHLPISKQATHQSYNNQENVAKLKKQSTHHSLSNQCHTYAILVQL